MKREREICVQMCCGVRFDINATSILHHDEILCNLRPLCVFLIIGNTILLIADNNDDVDEKNNDDGETIQAE